MGTIQSNILDKIGLGNVDIGYILLFLLVLIIIVIILYIVQITKYNKLKLRMDKFLTGKKAASLEEDIAKLYAANIEYKKSSHQNNRDIKNLYKKMETTFQKFGLVKYNAFKEMGGQLSFSLAMLNENDDGYLINSVHSSDGCYTYTKEITKGMCSLVLGKEEQEALDIAMKM